MKCYAVIDTNVLVSSLLSKYDTSATSQVVFRTILGEIIPVYSVEILAEYREVLSRKKFKFPSEQVEFLLNTITEYGILVKPSPTGVELPNMKDLPFYDVVMEKRSDDAYLVTGNIKHFPTEPFIITARQMIDILDGKTGLT